MAFHVGFHICFHCPLCLRNNMKQQNLDESARENMLKLDVAYKHTSEVEIQGFDLFFDLFQIGRRYVNMKMKQEETPIG